MRGLLVSLALLLASYGLAGGRLACRSTMAQPPRFVCLVEQEVPLLFVTGLAGVEISVLPQWSLTQYLGLVLEGNPWIAFQVATYSLGGWTFSISGGLRW